MAYQKVCKKSRDDILKLKVTIYKALSLHLFTLQLHSNVKRMQGWDNYYLREEQNYTLRTRKLCNLAGKRSPNFDQNWKWLP